MTNQTTPTGEFQAHFGSPPGSTDAASECKKWEKLCAELLAERQKLQDELTNVQLERDRYRKTINHFMDKDYVCPYTSEELLSFVGKEPPLSNLIAEIERDAESAP